MADFYHPYKWGSGWSGDLYSWGSSWMYSKHAPPTHPLLNWRNSCSDTFYLLISNIAYKHKIHSIISSTRNNFAFQPRSVLESLYTPGLLESLNIDLYEAVTLICSYFNNNYADTIISLTANNIEVRFKFFKDKNDPIVAHYSALDLRSPFNAPRLVFSPETIIA